jgi:hypothetical protein
MRNVAVAEAVHPAEGNIDTRAKVSACWAAGVEDQIMSAQRSWEPEKSRHPGASSRVEGHLEQATSEGEASWPGWRIGA